MNASGHIGRFETTQKLSWKPLSVSGKMGLRDPCPHAPLCSASLCLKPSRFLSGEAGQGSAQSPSSGRGAGGFWPSSLWLFYALTPFTTSAAGLFGSPIPTVLWDSSWLSTLELMAPGVELGAPVCRPCGVPVTNSPCVHRARRGKKEGLCPLK